MTSQRKITLINSWIREKGQRQSLVILENVMKVFKYKRY